MLGRVGEVGAGQFGDVLGHANVTGSCVQQAGLRREVESFDDEVNDRACAASVTGEGLKGVSHQGAVPLACSSSLGTRNMLSARWRCSASQPTTVRGSGAATSTSASLVATHCPMNGSSASALGRCRVLRDFGAGERSLVFAAG